MKYIAYLFQWRAFCERTKRNYKDAFTEEDEAVIAAFHNEVEKGLTDFERDAKNGDISSWPERTLHPTQGLPALSAAFRASCLDVMGREKMFVLRRN